MFKSRLAWAFVICVGIAFLVAAQMFENLLPQPDYSISKFQAAGKQK